MKKQAEIWSNPAGEKVSIEHRCPKGSDNSQGMIENLTAWIVASWDPLATVAWDGYQAIGRGCLIVQLENDMFKSLGYYSVDKADFDANDPTMKMVKRYDPNRVFICIVIPEGSDDQDVYRFICVAGKDWPTPPEARKQLLDTDIWNLDQ